MESVWAINWRITLRMSDIISFSDWISSVVASQAGDYLGKQAQRVTQKNRMGRSNLPKGKLILCYFLPNLGKSCCGEATSGALKTFLDWKKNLLCDVNRKKKTSVLVTFL